MSGNYRDPHGYGFKTYDKDEWLQYVADGSIKPQPPRWWLEFKETPAEGGRTIAASASIWHRNYKPERKFVIWAQAPDEDFRERGYLV